MTPAANGTSTWFDDAFAGQSAMVILRGHDPGRTVELCSLAWDLGITQVEVPVQSPDALPSLRAAVAAARERGLGAGAGTVTTVDQLEDVAASGVTFTVAPGLDDAVVRRSAELALPHLPGVATPSEIQHAARLGLTWLKAFPASVLGPAWFRAVRAPFPHVRLVATGGITAAGAREYLDAGARVVALGSAVGDPGQLAAVQRVLDETEEM